MQELEEFLSRVNYYRFTGYLYPFRSSKGEKYESNTKFRIIKNIYDFDTELRLLTLAAIEVIEIAILRTRLVKRFTETCGAFCYTKHKNFDPTMPTFIFDDLLKRIKENIERSNEEFVNLYKTKYSDEQYLPMWMVAEVSTFGLLSMIFQYLPKNIKVPIANQFNLHSRDLTSWLHCLSTVRNICAHHSRLWNRTLPVKPTIPSQKHHPEFYYPTRLKNDSFLVILVMMHYFLKRLVPEKNIVHAFDELLKRYNDVPIYKMGFSPNWHDHQVFQ